MALQARSADTAYCRGTLTQIMTVNSQLGVHGDSGARTGLGEWVRRRRLAVGTALVMSLVAIALVATVEVGPSDGLGAPGADLGLEPVGAVASVDGSDRRMPVVRPNRTARRRVGGERDVDADASPDASPSDRDATVDAGPIEIVRLDSIHVPLGEFARLPAGEVRVAGDVQIEGSLDASRTTLVLDGASQVLSGNLIVKRVLMRGGIKRLVGRFTTLGSEARKPGEAALYVEAGSTLIVAESGRWHTAAPYGVQIAGDLVIEGGEFRCAFSNGDGTGVGEDSWLPGSTLTVRSGRFHGQGDADFSGATVTIYGGTIEITDDIWCLGQTVNVYGGVIANAARGGMFRVTGALNMTGGELRVRQNASRGLQFTATSSVSCSGGEITLQGADATSPNGGILLARSVSLPDVSIRANTKIAATSDPAAYLAIHGRLSITKGAVLDARGHAIVTTFEASAETGRIVN